MDLSVLASFDLALIKGILSSIVREPQLKLKFEIKKYYSIINFILLGSGHIGTRKIRSTGVALAKRIPSEIKSEKKEPIFLKIEFCFFSFPRIFIWKIKRLV